MSLEDGRVGKGTTGWKREWGGTRKSREVKEAQEIAWSRA